MAIASPTVAVLVVTGEAGTAARVDVTAAPAEFLGSIIDDWTVRPTAGRPVSVIVVKIPAGHYMLTLSQTGLGETPTLEFLLCEPLTVATDQQAREAARHLARAVVHGTLPAEPRTPDGLATWQMCSQAVARIVARAWPSQQPRGR